MRYLLLVLLFVGCSSGNGPSRGVLRVGIDADWYPIDFGTQTSYVNGYAEDLLLEMARYTGIEFERIPANWDTLLDGLKENKYDAIFTSMNPYEYNRAKYDFSSPFLDLGPVLIVPTDAPRTDLSKMGGDLVGIIVNDPAVAVLESYPALIIRNYSSIPDLLNALVAGDIQAAVLNQVPAVNFVSDLYADKLQIVGEPMTGAGLRLAALKKGNKLVASFNKSLESLRKKKTLAALRKKWQLGL